MASSRADIIGGDAHADMQDQRRGGEYGRHHLARGVATTLLMHSFGGRERTGATAQELRIGAVAPNPWARVCHRDTRLVGGVPLVRAP